MFKRLGLLTLDRGSLLRSNAVRNNHSFGGSQRSQSSFSFLNNPSLLQKEQVKQSRRKNRKSVCKVEDEPERPLQRKITTDVKTEQKQKRDYSWLPRVPSTTNLKPRDMSMKVLYSGYRPLFIDPDEVKTSVEGSKSGGTLYEFAMRLEELGGQSPWVTSATGLEYYREWENVPEEMQKRLKPFVAPENEQSGKDTSKGTLKKLNELIYLQERDKVLNRGKGRKRPIVSLLQLRKKLKQDE